MISTWLVISLGLIWNAGISQDSGRNFTEKLVHFHKKNRRKQKKKSRNSKGALNPKASDCRDSYMHGAALAHWDRSTHLATRHQLCETTEIMAPHGLAHHQDQDPALLRWDRRLDLSWLLQACNCHGTELVIWHKCVHELGKMATPVNLYIRIWSMEPCMEQSESLIRT